MGLFTKDSGLAPGSFGYWCTISVMNLIGRRVARIQLVFMVALVLAGIAIAPAVLSAKDDDLTATVRAAILSDPRSETMSQTEVDAMVNALVEEARVKGVTAEDIVWWPADTDSAGDVAEEQATCVLPAFLCALNEAFGFSSDDLTIPLALFASSMVLLLVLSLMIKLHKERVIIPPPPLF